MKYMRKIHNRREPPGLEWTILKKLPIALVGGTVIPLLVSFGTRYFPPAIPAFELEKHITMIDMVAIASVITIWTAVFTIAIGCVVVIIMKGPAYVADGYELSDSSEPRQRPGKSRKKR